MTLACLKPKDCKRPKVLSFYTYPDGREVCSDRSAAGKAEYRQRRRIAWTKQGKRCAICQKVLAFNRSVSDHIKPRGMNGGKRDDRQENIQATCWDCNSEKGSKRS